MKKKWFEKLGLIQDTHSSEFWNKGPNGGDHSFYEFLLMLPVSLFLPWYAFYVYLGSVCFWVGLEMWQNWKGVRDGWERNKQWWNPTKWNRQRHQDWILPTISGIVTLGIVFAIRGVIHG